MELYKTYISPYRWPFLAAVLCVTFEAFCDLLVPTLMAQIINTGIEQGSVEQVFYWGERMLLVTAAGAGFAAARNILASYVSQRVGADLRRDLFEKMLRFSEESIDKIQSGSLLTRLTNDTSQVVQFINGVMRIFLKAPVTCVGSIVLATLLNPALSLVIYGVVLAVALSIVFVMRLSYPRYAKLQLATDRLNAVAQEYLIGIRLVKSFGTYGEETSRFKMANDALRDRSIDAMILIARVAPFLHLTIGIGTALVIWLGSRMFPERLVGVGDIMAFTIYMTQILISLVIITNVFNAFVRTKASAARVREVFSCAEDFLNEGAPSATRGDVEFRNVSFSYPGGSGVPALRNLSFSLPHGASLAVIGPTGSGKSTISWLLLRFYDCTTGEIFVGGRNIRTLSAEALRRSIAFVPQNPALFGGSIADNIRWGDPSADEAAVTDAAKKARADFYETMEHGLDSRVGTGGAQLSGGQKQRVSIARALLRNTPLLILDDATSALDAVTEAAVRQQLDEEKERRAVLLVTQRCAAARFADRVLVMENGVCAGFGTHDELLRTSRVYREIYDSQIGGEVS